MENGLHGDLGDPVQKLVDPVLKQDQESAITPPQVEEGGRVQDPGCKLDPAILKHAQVRNILFG